MTPQKKKNVTKIKSRPSISIQDHRILNELFHNTDAKDCELNPCLGNVYHVGCGLLLGMTIPTSQGSAIYGLHCTFD
jgi:glycerol-3-phosphate dehydrogenase